MEMIPRTHFSFLHFSSRAARKSGRRDGNNPEEYHLCVLCELRGKKKSVFICVHLWLILSDSLCLRVFVVRQPLNGWHRVENRSRAS